VKSRQWREFLEEQKQVHGKTLFTVTELANVAGASREALNVELSRLRRQGVILRYAQGRYGLAGAVTLETLLRAIDSHAYMTGLHALHAHNLVTQVPAAITCFTDKRSPRARIRTTPMGRLVFTCVRSRVYCPPRRGVLAEPEQALCDFVYLCRRQGIPAEGQASFRGLRRLRKARLPGIWKRYPAPVREEVRRLLGKKSPAPCK
jgi:hypothetical protein